MTGVGVVAVAEAAAAVAEAVSLGAAAQQGAAIENGRIHRRYAPIVGDGVLFSYWSGRLSQVKLTTGRKTAP